MAKEYVKFETPSDVQKKALEAVELAKNGGQVRKGTNECTKAIERAEASLIVIAEDVDPPEIVMHLPVLCAEKKVPYVFVKEKLALGKAAGLNVPSSAIAITKPGSQQNESNIKDIVSKMSGKFGFKAPEPIRPPAKKEKPAPKKKEEGKPPAPQQKPAEKPHEAQNAKPHEGKPAHEAGQHSGTHEHKQHEKAHEAGKPHERKEEKKTEGQQEKKEEAAPAQPQ